MKRSSTGIRREKGLIVLCGAGELGVAASMLVETAMQYRLASSLLGAVPPDLQAAVLMQIPAPLLLTGCALGLLGWRIRDVIPLALLLLTTYLLAVDVTGGTLAAWVGAAFVVLLIGAHLWLWRNWPQSPRA